MRIAILMTGLDGGGTQRRLTTLASGFLARGHDVEFVVGSPRGTFAALVPRGASVHPLQATLHALPGVASRKSLRMLAALPSLAAWLRAGRADVLLCGSNPANVAGLVARESSGARLPVVACVNVPLSRSTAERSRLLLGRLARRLYPRADAIVANCRALADDAVDFARVDPSRVRTIPNPVDTGRIAALAAGPAPHAWAADPATPLVLAVGKLKPQKDHATLLRAFRLVRDARPARLLVLGEGEERGALARLACSLGIADDVAMPGFAANPFAAMARADVFVSSSRWEGFSNVVAEALASGCPVVATDCPGGVAETLGEGRVGRLVAVGDAGALARAILATLEQSPDREALRAWASRWSPERAAGAYLDVLAGVAGRGPAGERCRAGAPA